MNKVPKPDVSKPVAATPGAAPRLGGYEKLGVLGRGGSSIVHKARDNAMGRIIAIKEYMPEAIAHYLPNGRLMPKSPEHQEAFQAGLKSFLNEARLLAQFTHPALVHVYNVWEGNGTAYMSMQYCVGKTLYQISESEPNKVRDESWLKVTFAPILDALELLHANNCYHRDIAPDNIMILNNGAPVLLDFGAARQILAGMTQAVTVVLKPGFAPVEQYADDGSVQQGPWTDVYGVGAVLYYLLMGKPPLAAVVRGVKDPMAKLVDTPELAGVSRSFREAIDRALAVQSSQRIQSIAELRQALRLPTFPQMGRFSKTAGADSGPMPSGLASAGVEAPQPSGSPLDEPDGTALVPPITAIPAIPEEDPLAIDTDESLQVTQMPAFELEDSEKIPDTPPEEEPPPDGPDSVQPDDDAPAPVLAPVPAPALSPSPPASTAWALAFSYFRQGTRITAKTTAEALKRNAARVMGIIGRSPWLRNALVPSMTAVVGLAVGFAIGHQPAPEGAVASSQARPPANSPVNTAMAAPPGISGQTSTAQGDLPGNRAATVSEDADKQPPSTSETDGQAPTAQDEPSQDDTVATSEASDSPKADGGSPMTAGSAPASAPTSLVRLSIKPWGYVVVDGQLEGASPPIKSLALSPGHHTMVITHEDSPPVYIPITVREGKDIVVSYQFE